MLKVNIVTDNPSGRIKRRISERIIQYNKSNIEYSMDTHPRDDVDINFYNCFNGVFWHGFSNKKNVVYVTHIHKSIEDHENEVKGKFFDLNKCDGFLHESYRTYDQFKKANIGSGKYHEVVWCGIEQEKFIPTITLGIVQNGEVEGKGLFFMMDLIDKFDFKNFKFIFQGLGWEILCQKMHKKGIRYECNPSLDYSEYPKVYEKIDYLLIPSLWEGGPMAALEAMCCGVGIISADVGWIGTVVSHFTFKPGNYIELIDILNGIQLNDILKYKNVSLYTCTAFSDRLAKAFSRIANG